MATKKILVRIVIDSEYSFYHFDFLVHESDTLSEQRLGAEEFYKKWTGGVHEGTHFEIQILSDMLINNKTCPNLLHTHPSEKHKDELYVCWTGHVPTLTDAISVIKLWSVGSVFTLQNNKDFASLAYEKGENFLGFVKEKYTIRVINEIID